jgi:transglutaminase-like putative cysteine protease
MSGSGGWGPTRHAANPTVTDRPDGGSTDRPHGGGRPGRPTLAVAWAVGATSLIGAMALCTIVGGFPGSRSVAPVLVTTGVGAVVTGALLRTRRSAAASSVVGAVAVLVSATATTVPRATWFGLPTATTYRLLHHDASAARASLRAPGIPYHAVPDVVLLAAVVAGMLALLAQVVLISDPRVPTRRSDRRLVALVPSLGLVVWAAAVDSIRAATALTAGFVVVAVIELALPGRAEFRGRADVRPAGLRGKATVIRLSPAALLAMATAVAVVVAGVSVGAAASTDGSGGGAGTNGPTSELRLLSSVVGLERRNPSTVVFTATTSVPTYWEVGALTVYRDGTWQPPSALAAEADGRVAPVSTPPVLPGRTAGQFHVQVTVDDLAGRLVPLPPDTVAVDAPFGVVRTPAGTVAQINLTAGQRYTATATVPSPVDTNSSGATPTSDRAAGLSPAQQGEAVALPTLPPAIRSLAATITTGAGNSVTQAVLLENWFRSGAFHYSLSPTALPPGTAGLVDFLTTGRTGTCEQFAGAFAVLARSLGLPTRVMVGFTTGRSSPAGTTTVRGADAHAWPQVYLGAAAGWVSFEPTPSLPTGESTPSDVVGPTRITAPPRPAPSETPTTVPTSVPTGSTVPTSVPTTVPPGPSTTVVPTVPSTAPVTATTSPATGTGATVPSSPRRRRPVATSNGWLVVLLVVVVAALGAAGLVLFRRRRRGAGHRSLPSSHYPAGPVGEAWRSIDRSLLEAGVPRPGSLSPSAYGRRLADAMERYGGGDRWSDPGAPAGHSAATLDRVCTLVVDVVTVADLLERSVFGGEPVGTTGGAEAAAAARRVYLASGQPDVRRVLGEMVGRIGSGVVSLA